jgi:hypothetical protein
MRGIAKAATALCATALLAGAAAVPANAATTLLVTDHGAELPPGEEVHDHMTVIPINNALGECKRSERGSITANGKTSDKLAFSSIYEQSCTKETAISGAVKEIKATAKGAISVKFSPKLELTIPGPCVWATSKASGTFTPGGELSTVLFWTGKLNKKASLPTCPKKEAMEALFALGDESDFQLFTELRG